MVQSLNGFGDKMALYQQVRCVVVKLKLEEQFCTVFSLLLKYVHNFCWGEVWRGGMSNID